MQKQNAYLVNYNDFGEIIVLARNIMEVLDKVSEFNNSKDNIFVIKGIYLIGESIA